MLDTGYGQTQAEDESDGNDDGHLSPWLPSDAVPRSSASSGLPQSLIHSLGPLRWYLWMCMSLSLNWQPFKAGDAVLSGCLEPGSGWIQSRSPNVCRRDE